MEDEVTQLMGEFEPERKLELNVPAGLEVRHGDR
jgi:hypothetical protein